MKSRAVTRADLAEAVYHEVGLTRKASSELVEELLEDICHVLEQGETVKISGFGNFAVRQKRKRIGRNPKTGEEVPIAPRKVLVFRASHILKDKVNRGA
jgi:integration host factor subunit alpha